MQFVLRRFNSEPTASGGDGMADSPEKETKTKEQKLRRLLSLAEERKKLNEENFRRVKRMQKQQVTVMGK